MPAGSFSCPGPEPAIPARQLSVPVQISASALPSFTPQPKASLNSPVAENSSTRLFAASETQTLPLESTASPCGLLSLPLPEPCEPNEAVLTGVAIDHFATRL